MGGERGDRPPLYLNAEREGHPPLGAVLQGDDRVQLAGVGGARSGGRSRGRPKDLRPHSTFSSGQAPGNFIGANTYGVESWQGSPGGQRSCDSAAPNFSEEERVLVNA
jgi:hypothetical protein